METVTATGTGTGTARRAEADGPEPQTRLRIAFVDDHPTLLMGMSALFATNPLFEIVGSQTSAAGAVDIARAQRPDVLTMDLSMPGDVNAAISEALSASPATKVIIFTAYADVERALQALDAGAHGFVLKGRPAEELLEAIDTVRRGGLYISPEFSDKVLVGLRQRTQREREKNSARLSPREKQLVHYLFEAKSNKEIARELNLTEKTVKHYMTNLMNKLKVKSRLEVVLAARRLNDLSD